MRWWSCWYGRGRNASHGCHAWGGRRPSPSIHIFVRWKDLDTRALPSAAPGMTKKRKHSTLLADTLLQLLAGIDPVEFIALQPAPVAPDFQPAPGAIALQKFGDHAGHERGRGQG